MRLIAEGKAPKITQPAEGATYECIQKKDNAKVEHKCSYATLHPQTQTCRVSVTAVRSFVDLQISLVIYYLVIVIILLLLLFYGIFS